MKKRTALFLAAMTATGILATSCAGGLFSQNDEGTITTAEAPSAEIQQKFRNEYGILKRLDMVQQNFVNKDGDIHYCQGVYNADKPGKFAILVFLHGGGEGGNENLAQIRLAVSEIVKHMRDGGRKVIVLAPQCPDGEIWAQLHRGGEMAEMREKPFKTVGMIPALIKAKIKEFDADADRVYATGLSMGGYGTWDLLQRYGTDVFAGGIVCCGGADPNRAKKMKNLPVWIFHGNADNAVPIQLSRYQYVKMREAGNNNVFFREYPGVEHNCWDRTYANDEVWTWLFSQKRGTVSGVRPAQEAVVPPTEEQYAEGFGFNGGPKSRYPDGFLPPFPSDEQLKKAGFTRANAFGGNQR